MDLEWNIIEKYKFLRPSVYAISKETLYKLPTFPRSGLLKKKKKPKKSVIQT